MNILDSLRMFLVQLSNILIDPIETCSFYILAPIKSLCKSYNAMWVLILWMFMPPTMAVKKLLGYYSYKPRDTPQFKRHNSLLHPYYVSERRVNFRAPTDIYFRSENLFLGFIIIRIISYHFTPPIEHRCLHTNEFSGRITCGASERFDLQASSVEL